MLKILKSKLKTVIVTDANIEYEGSLTLDPNLMDAAGIVSYEYVEINGKNTKERISTYVIRGVPGSGQVELNGGAAQFFKAGDEIHVNCFWYLDDYDNNYEPIIVYTDENNKVTEIE